MVLIKHLLELSRGDFDLVYGNTHFGAFYAILGLLKGVPLFFDMHGGVEEISLINQHDPRWMYSKKGLLFLFGNILEFTNLHVSRKIICVSRKMIQHLHEHKGIPLKKMIYVTNGVDLQFFKPANNEHIQAIKRNLRLEGKFVFGYIGGGAKWQGIENFIEATKRIKDPRLAFVIVGGEKDSKEGNLFMVSKIPRNQISDYYAICDVLVLPRPNHIATDIAAPTKFAEYTAMGKPVLTTNVGDAASLVKQYANGIVVENNQVENLIKGIIQFRDKSQSELCIMGKNSRILAINEFDWNKVAVNLLETAEEIRHH
jgi:glycosyltransferase involved in cell wall biosynthesis